MNVYLKIRQPEVLVFDANITHNLTGMAEEAGIYQHLWHPEDIGITRAWQLIEPLRIGIALMKVERLRFKKHDAINGWGTYDNFVPWVEEYLAACERTPEAYVSVSR